MSQPKFDRHWLKQMQYASVYGGGLKGVVLRPEQMVKPLFWELDERKWMKELADMINTTAKGKQDGK